MDKIYVYLFHSEQGDYLVTTLHQGLLEADHGPLGDYERIENVEQLEGNDDLVMDYNTLLKCDTPTN
jgi:hypothetical protein